jgi:hypothetical protein
MIVTVRPGPVFHVWLDGGAFAEIPMSPAAALEIASKLLDEASRALRDAPNQSPATAPR